MKNSERRRPQGDAAEMAEVCPNCKNPYREDGRYCPFCGAPNGSPEVIPQVIEVIYGPPPVRRRHTCTRCGHTWTVVAMVDRERYCPLCGAPAETEAAGEAL